MEDGLNLYVFAANNGVNFFDALGLWKWEGGKRQGRRRATVIAEKSKDPYEDLAKLVRLDANEIRFWLEPRKKNEKVCKDDKFTVPNTFVNALGSLILLAKWLQDESAYLVEEALKKRGFYVEYYKQEDGYSANDVIDAIRNKDTWGYGLFGHGIKFGDHGGFMWNSEVTFTFVGFMKPSVVERIIEVIVAADLNKIFKYGLGINYHCFSGWEPWYKLSLTHYGTGPFLSFALGSYGPRIMFPAADSWESVVGNGAD